MQQLQDLEESLALQRAHCASFLADTHSSMPSDKKAETNDGRLSKGTGFSLN
jgi:hypothetical protein